MVVTLLSVFVNELKSQARHLKQVGRSNMIMNVFIAFQILSNSKDYIAENCYIIQQI